MKVIKNIIVYSLFFTLYIFSAQEEKKPNESVKPVSSVETPAEKTKTVEVKPAEEKKPAELKPESKEVSEKKTTTEGEVKPEGEKAKPEEEKILQPWHDHLKKLLEKGALWNEANKIPSDDWKSEAFTIAKNSIEKDKTVANELKSSFETIVNEKIILENSTSNQASTEFITAFKNYIDELIKPKEEVKTETEKPVESEEKKEEKKEEEKAAPTEEVSVSVEETPALAGLMTESSQPVEPTPSEKPQELPPQDSWINYLKNISKEVSNAEFIKNAHKKAYDLLSSLPSGMRDNARNKIREEFQKALEYQAGQQYIPNMQKIIQEFNKGLQESAIQPGFEMPPTMGISQQQQMRMEEFGAGFMTPPQGPMEMVGKERITGQYIEQPAVSLKEEDIKKSPELKEYQTIIEQEPVLINEQESQQQALNQELMEQMKQKTPEKEHKKNIIAQLMQTVFNIDIDKWFKTSKEEQIIENIPDVIETILNKERDIKEKNIKKNAYLSFQNTLLSFNSNKFWDSKNNRPNQEWLNKIKNELMVLIHYKMITIDQALYIIDNVLKFDNKVSEFNRTNIINNIKKFLQLEQSTLYTLHENDLPLRTLIALLD